MTDLLVPPMKSKGFLNRLKNVFRPGTSRDSNLPPAKLAEAAKLRAKYSHFRILVIGRANAGKTTVLKRVCNTNEDPVYTKINPTSKRGIHNVYEEFSFKNNPQFIFHDSPGFEAGEEQELQDVLSFLQQKSKAKDVMDQIHAIWFCFTPNVSRPLLGLEQKFFNEQLGGNVPVVAIFTKFDDLITQVYDRNKGEEENLQVACATLENKFEKPLRGYNFPPRAYVRFESIHEDEGNHQEQVGELIKQTAASIDDLALKRLFVTIQQNNLEVCIEYAVYLPICFNSDLIYKAGSWFRHCSFWEDYGEEKNQKHMDDNEGGSGFFTFIYVKNFRDTQFNAVPSMCSFIAVLICLEHSFWIAQSSESSDLTVNFIKAWEIYLETKRVLVDREVDDYLRSKGSDDWFTMKHCPSDEECAEFRKMVFNNLLPRPKTST